MAKNYALGMIMSDYEETVRQVKDIMTAYEQRVLREIENLIETRIEPQEKIISALMITINDLFVKVSAFMEAYEEIADEDFNNRVNEKAKHWQKEALAAMRNFDEPTTIPNDEVHDPKPNGGSAESGAG